MKDWLTRSVKTFVQTFAGSIITGVAYVFANITAFESIDAIWKYLFPIICAGVSAGICAVWNIKFPPQEVNK